jgi:hypothetical protein
MFLIVGSAGVNVVVGRWVLVSLALMGFLLNSCDLTVLVSFCP